jgi:hypothetical protein
MLRRGEEEQGSAPQHVPKPKGFGPSSVTGTAVQREHFQAHPAGPDPSRPVDAPPALHWALRLPRWRWDIDLSRCHVARHRLDRDRRGSQRSGISDLGVVSRAPYPRGASHARSRQARRAATSFGVRMVTSRFRTCVRRRVSVTFRDIGQLRHSASVSEPGFAGTSRSAR